MPYMFVTLEVSKLSGWSKAAAHCRVQRGHPIIREDTHGIEMAQKGKGESAAHAACVCGPAREGGQKAKAAQAACTESARL